MFYVKTCTGCHGVVFSYKAPKKAPFSLDYDNGVLQLSFGKANTWPSQITLEDNVWNFVAITWSRRLKEVESKV